jgi:hydroxymethylbilane synthase
MPSRSLRVGARSSPLSRAQVDIVVALLAQRGFESTVVGITTSGDRDQRHLTEIGGTGVFANAVRDALRAGEIDLAVHSLKDLPTDQPEDLEIIAIPEREDSRDVLVGRTLDQLTDGSVVGTGAPRRVLQLEEWAWAHGIGLEFRPIRGNVDTRIRMVAAGTVDAVILAAAGLRRLGHLAAEPTRGRAPRGTSAAGTAKAVVDGLPAQILDEQTMLPAPGQGALGLEVHRELSASVRDRIAALDNPVARAECLVERGFLATLEAGCTAPVGARAVVRSARGTSVDLTLTAVIGRTLQSSLSEPPNGVPALRLEVHGSTSDPAGYGAAAAHRVLGQLHTHNALGTPRDEAETTERESSQ